MQFLSSFLFSHFLACNNPYVKCQLSIQTVSARVPQVSTNNVKSKSKKVPGEREREHAALEPKVRRWARSCTVVVVELLFILLHHVALGIQINCVLHIIDLL